MKKFLIVLMKTLLVIIFLASIVFNIIFILDKNITIPQINYADQTINIDQLKKLATKFEIIEVDNYMANDLLNEIIIKTNNGEGYYGGCLSEENIKNIEEVFCDDEKIIKIIKEQHEFLKKIQGKEILILN